MEVYPSGYMVPKEQHVHLKPSMVTMVMSETLTHTQMDKHVGFQGSPVIDKSNLMLTPKPFIDTRWCPSSLVKLVQISQVSRVDGGYNYSIHGDYKPTYN